MSAHGWRTNDRPLAAQTLREACRMCGGGVDAVGEVGGFAFVRCSECEFVFTPQITPDVLNRLYRSGWHGPEQGAPETGWADDTGAWLEPAFERLPGDGPLRILDFGTGQSLVPDRLREQGHRVIAMDVAEPLRPHPDRLTGSLFELDLPERSFDLVYSYQVFEHLPEPRPFLERLLEHVKPGGLLLIHTDMEMPEREREGFEGWWYVTPPDHCAFYRHRTFETFFEDRPERLVWKDAKRVLVQVPEPPDE